MNEKSRSAQNIEESSKALDRLVNQLTRSKLRLDEFRKSFEGLNKQMRGGNRKALETFGSDVEKSMTKASQAIHTLKQKGRGKVSLLPSFQQEMKSLEADLRRLPGSYQNTMQSILAKTRSVNISKGIGRALGSAPTSFLPAGGFNLSGLAAGGATGGLLSRLPQLVRLLGAMGPVAMGAATAVGTLAGAFVTLAGVMIPIASSMRTVESQIIRLKSAMQSSVKAVGEFQKSVLFAGTTPFAVGDVTESVAGLRTFQFDPFKMFDAETGRTLIQILGDMAGAMGTDLATASWALQRAMVGEWEIMQNNFQISARMIPQLQGLASGTTAYGEAIVKYLGAQNRFKGGMEETARSIKGLISNITDAPSNFLIGVGSVDMNRTLLHQATLYQGVTQSLKRLYDAVSEADALTRMSQALVGISTAGEKGQKALDGLLKGTLSFRDIKAMQVFEGGLTDQALAGFKQLDQMKRLGLDLNAIKALMADPSKSMATKQGELLKMGGIDAAYSRIERIIYYGQLLGQVLKVVWNTIVDPMFEAIGRGIDWVLDKFQAASELILPPLEQLASSAEDTLSNTIQRVASNLGVTSQQFALGLETLSADLNRSIREQSVSAMGPLQKSILIFAILMEFLALFLKDKFQQFLEFFAPITEAVVILRDTFMEAFGEALGEFNWGPTLSALGSFTELVVDLLKWFIRLNAAVLHYFRPALAFVGSLLGSLLRSSLAMFQSIIGIVGGIADIILGVFTLDWDRAYQGLKNTFSSLLTLISHSFFGAIGALWNAFKAAAREAFQVVTNLIGNIFGEGAKDKILAIADWFIEAFQRIGEWWDKNASLEKIAELFQTIGHLVTGQRGEPPSRNFYGSMNTKEGLHYLHRGEMIVPERFASAFRENVLGIQGQPGGTGHFEPGLSRATSRPVTPDVSYAAMRGSSGGKSVSVNAPFNLTVQGNMDKTTVHYAVKRYMQELKEVTGRV